MISTMAEQVPNGHASAAHELTNGKAPAGPPAARGGDVNWVGLLEEYSSVYHHNGARVNYIDYHVSRQGNECFWQCDVKLPEEPDLVFPHGCPSDRRGFPRKKEAKQYAAECAVKWLREKGWMPQNGVKFPKDTGRPCLTPTTLRYPPPEDPPFPAVDEVAELCKGLWFPILKYIIKPCDNNRLWCCRVDFGPNGDLLPECILKASYVDKTFSEKLAKGLVAEKLREALREEKQIRDEQNQAFLANQDQNLNRLNQHPIPQYSPAPNRHSHQSIPRYPNEISQNSPAPNRHSPQVNHPRGL
ncbi:hypothetical protein RRF57_007715 [Xylaria bambusicola]|uniref:DRBM domain-containing protein n=1 Tax=Xylaria bambusicola TaxID=326684 RepID=A0AAN7ZAL6_9PEZI